MNKKKQVRQNFRDAVFKRDGYKCKFCDETENLDAHHITNRNDMPNGGYVKENGISLCPKHHEMAESAYWWSTNSSFTKVRLAGFNPDELYVKIDSSYELAKKKSEML